jgi:hypothetical protein
MTKAAGSSKSSMLGVDGDLHVVADDAGTAAARRHRTATGRHFAKRAKSSHGGMSTAVSPGMVSRDPRRNARLRQQLRRTLTFADQLIELGTFLRGQPRYVLLDGDLFPGHESPPSLACGDRDSEVAVIFNDGGD